MRKTKLTFLVFLFLSFTSFSQKSLTDEEQRTLVENDLLESHLLNNSIAPAANVMTTPNDPPAQFPDADDDGMDDDWETANGLNPNDAKDAWGDVDNDYILNLFEFQLETNPNDANSPAIIQLTPADGAAVLDDKIQEAENDIRVIRLAQGNYDAGILAVWDQDFRIMIQGGWNDDFTAYNPLQYPTNWSTVNNEALNILIPVDNETVTKSTVILDGINFLAIETFSLSGAVRISTYSGYAATSIYNCTFNNNTYYGFSHTHKSNTIAGDVFIVNSIMGNNMTGGIYTQVVDEVFARWRFFHTTINNPEGGEGGFDGLTLSGGQLKIELTNSINWGNNNFSFNFSSFAEVTVETLHSNVDEAAYSILISNLGNTIDTDPLFQDAMGSDWSLATGSPCIDTGIDVGLPFSGAAPDMGAIQAILSSVDEPAFFNDIKIYPNPLSNYIHLELDELIGQSIELNIYDVLGNLLRTEKRINTGKLRIATEDLQSGVLIINVQVDDLQYSARVMKQ